MNENLRVPSALCFHTQLLEYLITKAASICIYLTSFAARKFEALAFPGLNCIPIALLFAALAFAGAADVQQESPAHFLDAQGTPSGYMRPMR